MPWGFMHERIKAIGLVSGGLDSALACLLLREQGIDVEGVFFNTGFCVIGHHLALGKRKRKASQPPVFRVAADLGIPLSIIDISQEYLDLLLHPKYGYGSGMNPCKDCRIFMLQKAKAILESSDAHFIFTGEVIGQRPMSQLERSMRIIERDSGLEGYLLRPLSAKLLPPTEPEKRGWVDREKLCGISGRSRKEQLKLAGKFGLEAFAQPSGGCCYLPDKQFAKRLRDLLDNQGTGMVESADFNLLKVGRHFRLRSNLKIVLGRDEEENNFLEMFYGREYHLMQVDSGKGPVAVIVGQPDSEDLSRIAAITASYSNGSDCGSKRILLRKNGNGEAEFHAKPLDRSQVHRFMIK